MPPKSAPPKKSTKRNAIGGNALTVWMVVPWLWKSLAASAAYSQLMRSIHRFSTAPVTAKRPSLARATGLASTCLTKRKGLASVHCVTHVESTAVDLVTTSVESRFSSVSRPWLYRHLNECIAYLSGRESRGAGYYFLELVKLCNRAVARSNSGAPALVEDTSGVDGSRPH